MANLENIYTRQPGDPGLEKTAPELTTAQEMQEWYQKQYLTKELSTPKPPSVTSLGMPTGFARSQQKTEAPASPEVELLTKTKGAWGQEVENIYAPTEKRNQKKDQQALKKRAEAFTTKRESLDVDKNLQAKAKVLAARYKQLEEDHPMAVIGSEVALAMANPVLAAGIDAKDLARAWAAVERGEPWAVPLTVLVGLGLASNAVPVFGPLAKGAFKGVWAIAKNAPREVKAVAKGLQQGSEAIGEGTKHGLRALRQLLLQKKGKLPVAEARKEAERIAIEESDGPLVASRENISLRALRKLNKPLPDDSSRHVWKKNEWEEANEALEDEIEDAFIKARGQGSVRGTGVRGYDADQLAVKLQELKTGREIAEFFIKHAEAPDFQRIAHRILPFLDNVKVNVVYEGDAIPERLLKNRGLHQARWGEDATSTIWLKTLGGARQGRGSSMSTGTILHELLHAATVSRITEGLLDVNKGTKLYEAVEALEILAKNVAGAQQSLRHKEMYASILHGGAGNLEDTTTKSYLKELVTHGLTDREFQTFLKTIPAPGGNAFNEFVLLIKEILGLGPKEVDALSSLIQITDDVLAAQRDELSIALRPLTPQPKFLSERDFRKRQLEAAVERGELKRRSPEELEASYIPLPQNLSREERLKASAIRPSSSSLAPDAASIKRAATKKAMQGPQDLLLDDSGKPIVVHHGTPGGKFSERAAKSNAERPALIERKAALRKEIDAKSETLKELRTKAIKTAKAREDLKQKLLAEWREQGHKGRFDPEKSKAYRDLDLQAYREAQEHMDFYKEKIGPLVEEANKIKVPDVLSETDEFRTVSGGTTDWGYRSSGAYFTEDAQEAAGYAKQLASKTPYVYTGNVSMKTPYVEGVTKDPPGMWEEFNQELTELIRRAGRSSDWLDQQEQASARLRRQILEKYGFDGEIWTTKSGAKEYIIFNPEQFHELTP